MVSLARASYVAYHCARALARCISLSDLLNFCCLSESTLDRIRVTFSFPRFLSQSVCRVARESTNLLDTVCRVSNPVLLEHGSARRRRQVSEYMFDESCDVCKTDTERNSNHLERILGSRETRD